MGRTGHGGDPVQSRKPLATLNTAAAVRGAHGQAVVVDLKDQGVMSATW